MNKKHTQQQTCLMIQLGYYKFDPKYIKGRDRERERETYGE
jgi:hypothetical protein